MLTVMNGHFRIEGYGSLSFKSGIPTAFSSYLLSHATGHYVTGPWGLICIQEIQTEKYLLRHLLFSLRSTVSLYIQEQHEGLQSLLSLNGTFSHTVAGLRTALLGEKEYLLYNTANRETLTVIGSGGICSLLNAQYAPGSYKSLLPLFPSFKRDLRKALHKPFHFIFPAKVARYTVHDAIQALWFDKYIPTLQAKHTELRVEGSLFTLLAQSYAQGIPQSATAFEREKAAAARTLILQDIKVHLTPEGLASQLHLSASWLKKAFSKVYGTGPFQFLRKTRMERAKEMLLQGESLKKVALEVGMKPRNFPKEFKAFFGHTVTALKKGQV